MKPCTSYETYVGTKRMKLRIGSYPMFTVYVHREIKRYSACTEATADHRVTLGDSGHGPRWLLRWYRMGVDPITAARRCCYLDWGWTPRDEFDDGEMTRPPEKQRGIS